MPARFVQFHFLTSYPSALLNRDDAGFAKRMPFGGVTRTRVSSQCLKRHWRTFDGEHGLHELGQPASVRSRATFERLIAQPLVADSVPESVARAVTTAIMEKVLGKSEKKKKAKAKENDTKKGGEPAETSLRTEQVTVLGRPEVDFLLAIARSICAEITDAKQASAAVEKHLGKKGRKNLEAMRPKRPAGLDAALFGRMVTSDILSRGDAAIHVAHALTVHAEASESDYFSVVDDLLQEAGETGSGHINSSELTSGLYYGYVVVDVPLLVSNLEGCEQREWLDADRTLAAGVVERLAHLIATVSPGAKKGSTAPYAYAHLVLAETGTAQPRTLANAFLRPVREVPDVVANSYAALAEHASDLDRTYGARTARRVAGVGPTGTLTDALGASGSVPLADLAAWAAEQVRQ